MDINKYEDIIAQLIFKVIAQSDVVFVYGILFRLSN